MTLWRLGLSLLALLCGCERCSGKVPEELRVGGPTPYVRCLAVPPPKARQWRAGGARLKLSGRELSLSGLPNSPRIAAFSGPAFTGASLEDALKQVAAFRPALAIMLGGVGDDREKAARTLRLLGAMEFPTLVIPGGRDRFPDLQAAFSALEDKLSDRVIDAAPLRGVRIGRDTLVPIAGAAEGRYARDDASCGFSQGDLEKIAGDLGPANKERRWLLSWQAPAGSGALSVARTARGVDTGDPGLARFAERIGAPGGLFAWPDLQVMRPRAHAESLALPVSVAADDLRVVAPRLAGPAMERDDGSRRMPGFAPLILTKAGMIMVETQ